MTFVIELAGLVGLTIAIVKGKLFAPFREWSTSLIHPLNPIRTLGRLLSCSMCSGVWIGFGWGLVTGRPVTESVILGGVVSLISWGVGEALVMLEVASSKRVDPPKTMSYQDLIAIQQERRRRLRPLGIQRPHAGMTEDEAHAYLDDLDEREENAAAPPEVIQALRDAERPPDEAA